MLYKLRGYGYSHVLREYRHSGAVTLCSPMTVPESQPREATCLSLRPRETGPDSSLPSFHYTVTGHYSVVTRNSVIVTKTNSHSQIFAALVQTQLALRDRSGLAFYSGDSPKLPKGQLALLRGGDISGGVMLSPENER